MSALQPDLFRGIPSAGRCGDCVHRNGAPDDPRAYCTPIGWRAPQDEPCEAWFDRTAAMDWWNSRAPTISLGMVSALYVETGGCYFGVEGVDPWDAARDARTYPGPWPVVAHPPCQRWGRFWHGSTRKPHQFKFGDDQGCFAAALKAVRQFGGVLEHPAESGAWNSPNHPTKPGFGLPVPIKGAGWSMPDQWGGRACYVEQGHYGHPARKSTYLYAVGVDFDRCQLIWDRTRAKVPAWMIERYGEAKARKIGVVAMMGGKDKVRKRNASPIEFRDQLLAMARSVTTRRLDMDPQIASDANAPIRETNATS